MQTYLLVDNNGVIDDRCIADSESHADDIFRNKGWSLPVSISEADYLKDMENESDLNVLENQSPES
jgi:hypothetical protein